MVEFYTVEGAQNVAVAHWVPDYCASILDKKVQKVALSCLEWLVDQVFTCFSSNYVSLFRLIQVKETFQQDRLPTLLHFPNGVPLYSFLDANCNVAIQDQCIEYMGYPVYFNLRLEPIVFSQDTCVTLTYDAQIGRPLIHNHPLEGTVTTWSLGEPQTLIDQFTYIAKPHNDNEAAGAFNRAVDDAFVKRRFGVDPQEMRRLECDGIVIYENVRKDLGAEFLGDGTFMINQRRLALPPAGTIMVITDDPQKQGIELRFSRSDQVVHIDFQNCYLRRNDNSNPPSYSYYWNSTP